MTYILDCKAVHLKLIIWCALTHLNHLESNRIEVELLPVHLFVRVWWSSPIILHITKSILELAIVSRLEKATTTFRELNIKKELETGCFK